MNEMVVKEFFDAWAIYDAVLERNYMFHQEIYATVAETLKARFGDRPFAMLDLGCGSARHLAHALKEVCVSKYVGCDLSDVALDHAGRNLAGICGEVYLHQTDMLSQLSSGEEKYDVIFSSFVLHHLRLEDKQAFFELARQRLQPGGLLLLIDTARTDEEDLPVYLDRYCGWIQSDWNDLPPHALEFIYDHIRNHDFPEQASTVAQLAQKSGFPNATIASRHRWHHTWCFQDQA